MEQVVLLDEDGNGIGCADKASVHHRATPLHLAFSAYVFNPAGELLLTRRAPTKKTWPNTWTNSCCGHPAPGEPLKDAVTRRIREELGLATNRIDLILPRFRYRAEMANGVAENELCPVFRVSADGPLAPDPNEVDRATWVPWDSFVAAAWNSELLLSPWCREQLAQLTELAEEPQRWQTADGTELPPAARNTESALGSVARANGSHRS